MLAEIKGSLLESVNQPFNRFCTVACHTPEIETSNSKPNLLVGFISFIQYLKSQNYLKTLVL